MRSIAMLLVGALLGALVAHLAFGAEPPPPDVPPAEPPIPSAPGPAAALGPAGAIDPARPAATPAAERETAVAPTPTLDLDPSLGILVYGQARSRDGTPIDSCRLSFTPVDGNGKQRTATVHAGSGYAVTGFTPGRWRLYAKPTDHAELRHEFEVGTDRAQRIDWTFDPSFVVTVKMLTPDGRPIHDAIQEAKLGYRVDVLAVASREPFTGDLAMTELRGYSRFGIGSWRAARGFNARGKTPAAPDVAGTLELSVPPPIHVAAVFRHVVLATATVHAGDTEVVLEIPLDTVRAGLTTLALEVVDATTGSPIPKARVAISDSQSGGGGRPVDADGRIRLENERVGVLELDVMAAGYEHYHQLLRLEPGEHDLGRIALHPARKATVQVVDADGQPVAGATVQWQNLDRRTFPQPSRYRRSATTDGAGRCELAGLGPGRYLFQAFVRGQSAANRAIDVGRLGDEPVRLQLAPTSDVRFEPSLAVPRTGVHCLTVLDRQRTPVWARFVRGYATTAHLAAGDYTWELHDGTTLLRTGHLEVRAGSDPLSVALR